MSETKENIEQYKKFFGFLLKADEHMSQAAFFAHDSDDALLNKVVEPLMMLRGEVLLEVLRPIYNKHPELKELIENHRDSDYS